MFLSSGGVKIGKSRYKGIVLTTDSVRGGMRAGGGLLLELLNFLNRKIYFFRSYTNESGKNIILNLFSFGKPLDEYLKNTYRT